ncbi:MAG TPA: hypothetical protein VFY66_00825, partial [Anaerolineales bacterium]|nr:hypothetical protein [Anaerolineales bacterium]
RAYAGKTDKAGREYILHPLRVMAKMNTDLERSAALLHDVLEDSDLTAGELLAEGIPAEVVEAIQYLSKNEGEDYQNFVARAKRNKIAAKVKLADIEDNIDVLRLSSLNESDFARIKKYHTAWRLLQEELG